MAKPTHVVLRVIPGPQGDIYGGTLVDASAWQNTRLLEGSGYLRPLTDDEPLAAQSAQEDEPAAGEESPVTPKKSTKKSTKKSR